MCLTEQIGHLSLSIFLPAYVFLSQSMNGRVVRTRGTVPYFSLLLFSLFPTLVALTVKIYCHYFSGLKPTICNMAHCA